MKPRRLTFTCKPEGDSQKHDMVYRVMNLLPKGYRSDFFVEAVHDFILKNNGVQIIKKKNCVSILPIGIQGIVNTCAAQVPQASDELPGVAMKANGHEQTGAKALPHGNAEYQKLQEGDQVSANAVKKGNLAWFDDDDYE